jgi:hypothetical protein
MEGGEMTILSVVALAALLAVPTAPSGTTVEVPDAEIPRLFASECEEFSAALPDLAVPCADFGAGQSAATLRIYLGWMRTAKQELLAQGPKIAQSLVQSCLANAAAEAPDLPALLWCINLKKSGSDLEKLARGEGALPDYGRLAKSAADPVPGYPTEDGEQAERQRAEVRRAAVYACIEEGEGYLKALCGAVAIHEAFARRPFGDNGELAKAFDTVVQIHAVADAPRQVIQAQVRDALQRAGFNDQVAQAVADPAKGTVEGVKHVANEVGKLFSGIKFPK